MRRRFTSNKVHDKNYMYIEFEGSVPSFKFSNDIKFSRDKKVWITALANTENVVSGTIYFKKECTPDEVSENKGVGSFSLTNAKHVGGNIMSLLFGDNFEDKYNLDGYDYAFYGLFKGPNLIISVDSDFLPATTLTNSCYERMFYGCTSLVNAPELPATTLAESCYEYMFRNCTSLTTAPELPATTLSKYCYYGMFLGCTNLNYIKMLATDISAHHCLYHWVYDVASAGTFVKNKDATWNVRGVSGIPEDWLWIKNDRIPIYFTVKQVVFIAEKGMTWKDYIESEYNNLVIHESNSSFSNYNDLVQCTYENIYTSYVLLNSNQVNVSDFILSDGVYDLEEYNNPFE